MALQLEKQQQQQQQLNWFASYMKHMIWKHPLQRKYIVMNARPLHLHAQNCARL